MWGGDRGEVEWKGVGEGAGGEGGGAVILKLGYPNIHL